jgi:UDP-N-acetylmuramoylalanine--D-glutamate ligase
MSAYPRFFWIAGGVAKAGGIEALADLFPRVEKAYLIGEAAPVFAKTLDGHAPAQMSGDLATAVAQAFTDARAHAETTGEEALVLLSPACASFDQFADFEKRGDAFRATVQGLGEEALA